MASRHRHTRKACARRLGRSGSLLAVAAAATSVLAACGGVSTGSSGASGGGGATSGPTGKAPVGTVANSTLNLQFNAPVSLNPALGGTSESDVVYGALDYDSLIYQLGNGTYVPDLATQWGYAAGSKNEVFNLTLRKGVHFSDGSLMTTASVINSLEYFKKADGP